jgi:VIT1/CCC1 family predicted Fe2+/Mn2+ transporter
MPEPPADRPSMRVLEPIERITEVLFGLIMVLTITGSISVAEAGRENVRTMLIGALGCNLAWGLIDGVMYLMGCLSRQAEGIRTVLAVRRAAEPEAAHRVIAGAMPPLVASVFQPAELERVRLYLNRLPEPPALPGLQGRDWLGALGVFLLVFLSTLPVVLPFVFARETARALRVSNGIAIGMLFLTGYAFGRSTGYRPWAMGTAMVGVGCVLVGLTKALGG